MILPSLTIALSTKGGRGVFATKSIPANTIIEISPVLVLSAKERKTAEQTNLFNYFFEWGDSGRKGGLGMGYISMYNHDYNANCDYEMDFEFDMMKITTIRKINKGEELYINYNGIPNNTKPVWFDAKK